MQNTIIGVYDNLEEAEATRVELLGAGFSNDDVQLARDGESEPRTGKGGIKGFFQRMFGTSEQQRDVAMYEGAVRHGNYVVAVSAIDEQRSELATDVMNRHHPLDIDEKSSQWLEAEDTYATSATRGEQTTGTSSTEGRSIPVVREEMNVGKRQVEGGGVRIYQRVTEEPVKKEIRLKENRVSVGRKKVDRPASQADLQAFKEGTVELREQVEVPVVEKEARVVEEVEIGKEVKERTATVSDTVKRTEVEVQRLGEADFREHFDANFAASGARYEDYVGAYDYGTTMASEQRFRGRDWDQSESELRRDWETRNPDSGWEKFKGAIRHAWNKATGKAG